MRLHTSPIARPWIWEGPGWLRGSSWGRSAIQVREFATEPLIPGRLLG